MPRANVADRVATDYPPLPADLEWRAFIESLYRLLGFDTPTSPTDLSFADLFCGAGGSSTGLVLAGLVLKIAVNHWPVAVETHAKNHRLAEHLCADVNNLDMRRLPRTHVLWASPICTELSPGGGNKIGLRPMDGQVEIEALGHVGRNGLERTRATFYDVMRATEVWRYRYVIVENVPNALRWALFRWWCQGMMLMGYRMQIVSASSAHLGGVGNPPAPQWRDRIYIVFTRTDMPDPDLQVRPPAWCPRCEVVVAAVQQWKLGALEVFGQRAGTYKDHYTYGCPKGHARVEPYVRAAAGIINWDDLGVRISERAAHKLPPLKPATLAKVADGLRMLREGGIDDAALLTLNHGGHLGRAVPLSKSPVPTQTQRIGNGVVWPEAFIATLRNHVKPHSPARPLGTVTAGGNHHALVIPYRRGNRPTTTDTPLYTMTTRDSAALVTPSEEVMSANLRMLSWYEQMLTQGFPRDYAMTGNVGQRTAQAGNAVSCNAAFWIGNRIVRALNRV